MTGFSDVRQPLNPVKKNDIIIRINNVTYPHILSFLFNSDAAPAGSRSITIQRDSRTITFEPRANRVSLPRFLSTTWPHLLRVTRHSWAGAHGRRGSR